MNFFDKNMECIQKNRKFMYKSMMEADRLSTTNRLEEIYSVDTKNIEQAIVIKYNKEEYRLNSLYNPVMEAKKWADQYSFIDINNVISMFGFGNGIFARAIIEKMGQNDRFLIYEPCADIFYYTMENYDITDILSDKKVNIAVEKINEFEFHNSLRAVLNITNMNSNSICIYPQYDNIFVESCIYFWEEVKDTYRYTKTNINTEIVFAKRFIDNILNNVKYLKDSSNLNEIKELIPDDVPAIIVAAGPSVGKQIEDLKKAKGKSVIFAVDRILDYLLDSGIEPDFIVTIDPMKPLKYFSERTGITIPLMCFMEANHEILSSHKGTKIICNCTNFMEQIYIDANKKPPRTNSSSSVATLAYTICLELGFKNVILVGQDLAYDGELSHAGKVKENNIYQKEVMIEDINGLQVKSRTDWKEFATWYQDMIIMFPKLHVIDAKEKGAKIKGAEIMKLKDAIKQYCNKEYNYNLFLDKIELSFKSDDINNIKIYLEKNLKLLDKIKSKSKKSIKECNHLIIECEKKNSISGTDKKSLLILSKNNRYIVKQPIYYLINSYIMAKSAQGILEINHLTDDIKKNKLKTYNESKKIFEVMIEAVDYIYPRLEKAITDIS